MNKDNKDNDVLSEYFEVGEDSNDVYYTFKGRICTGLSGGPNNVLYGKRVNLSEMYRVMIDDVIRVIGNGLFYNNEYKSNSGETQLVRSVIKYTCDKYGVSLEWLDRVLNNSSRIDTGRLYEIMIERVGGVDKIDWMVMYNNSKCFYTGNGDIVMYIAKNIIKDSGIYSYFIDRYNLRVVGYDYSKMYNDRNRMNVILEWDGGSKMMTLSSLIKDKRDWWSKMTADGRCMKKRVAIKNYDSLIKGRDESDVLPDVCPIDTNIILNYTRIDFSVSGDSNISECKKISNNSGDDKTWSFASIDRIDSNREYDYDNVEIISHYYNTQVKSCANPIQTGKLFTYQLSSLLRNINIDSVKSMKDGELDYMFDVLSGTTTNIFENIHDKQQILLNEMEKRYLISL